MLKQTGLYLWVGALGAAACGGPSENDFSGPAAAGSATQAGSSGSSGSKTTGGAGGASAAAGQGGSNLGGSGGSAMGGSDMGGSNTGGSGMGGSGGSAMGGSDMGGSGGSAIGGSGGSAIGGTGLGGSAGAALAGSSGTGSGEVGGTGGGMAGKPGNGGSAGNEPSCEELAKAYLEAFTAAKACNAKSGKDQCTELVPGTLTCGCDQFVNPDNEEAMSELTRLRKQAGTHCATVCPAIACLPPAAGTCQSDSADDGPGRCVSGGPILD